MKKTVTFYNILFPVWFLILFPITWIVILPANFIIDSLVLLISLRLLNTAGIKEVYRRTIIKVWLIGFGSDFVGTGILFIGADSTSEWNEYLYSLSWNPFDNWYAVLYTAFAVIVSALLIYIGNYKLSFGSLDIKTRNKRVSALALAVLTAPYIFFYPSALINGSSWDELSFMTNHIVKRDEFRLEVAVNRTKAENRSGDPIIMYSQGDLLKDAINEADKIFEPIEENTGPDYTVTFYDRDYKDKTELPVWDDGNAGYFQYKDDWYKMDREKVGPFFTAVRGLENTKGKRGFTIEPDPSLSQGSDPIPEEKDKDGRKASEYPVFEDSRFEYYCEDRQLFDSAVIVFEDGEKSDINTVLESGLITPRELVNHGLKLIIEPRK